MHSALRGELWRLSLSCEAGKFCGMSTKAQAILEEIKMLSPDERREVCEEVLQLQERQRQWEGQKAALRRLQASSKGEGLLKALLEDRAKERARE
jgi:hypothetical protein